MTGNLFVNIQKMRWYFYIAMSLKKYKIKKDYPVVLMQNEEGTLDELIDKDSMNVMKDMNELMDKLKIKLAG